MGKLMIKNPAIFTEDQLPEICDAFISALEGEKKRENDEELIVEAMIVYVNYGIGHALKMLKERRSEELLAVMAKRITRTVRL